MSTTDVATAKESPVSFYYGWVMLPLSMLALAATSVGQTFGISTVNGPIRESLHLSHTQLAGAYMLGTILGAIPITYFGQLIDRFGLRNAMLATLALLSVSCLLLAAAVNWTMLLLAFFLLRMLGPGTLTMLSGNTLPFWFDRRLGLVEAVRKLSISLAMGGVPALNLWLMTFLTWRDVYLFWSGILMLGLIPPFVLLFKSRPEDVGQRIDHGGKHSVDSNVCWDGLTLEQALKTYAFWAITSGAALYALVATAIVFHLTPILTEHGLSEWDHARFMSILAISMACAQFAAGVLADFINPKPLMVGAHVALIAAVTTLHQSSGTETALVAASLIGIAQGLFFGVSQPLWARRFGRRHLGQITGMAMTGMVAASSGGPLVVGLIRDWRGTFNDSLILLGILPIPVILFAGLSTLPTPGDERRIDSEAD